jgi:ubiquinone/menaquinone biosynthesis C-methylase UbiE
VAGHRIFAALYDRLLEESERKGLGDLRSQLLSGAAGRTLEIGAGTGLNLEHYPLAVTRLVLTEPDLHMATRLRSRLAETTPVAPAEVVEASAEELPFDDTSFDTVVSTLTLCTVGDPERAAAEAKRVLRPDGRLLFIEHVRDEEGTGRARWQDRLERPWGWVAGGCHPNRDTRQVLARTFATVDADDAEFPGSGTALVKPVITGSARP